MKQKTINLLQGSHVSARTHPILVSLLEMAAQGARAERGQYAIEKRLNRDWKKVQAAFARSCSVKITDEMLVAAMPFEGLSFTEKGGWRIVAAVPLNYRRLVAAALDQATSRSGISLEPFDIRSLADLRRAIQANHLPSMEGVIHARGELEVKELLPGRRIIVRFMIYHRAVHALIQADEFGRLRALRHEHSRLAVLKFHEKHPAPPEVLP